MKKSKRRKKRLLNRILKKIFDLGVFVLVVLIITFLLSKYVVERIAVHNYSMEPTLKSESGILIDKISYKFHDPQRFDIVVFRQKNTGDELIKRVIALPHETVQIVDGSFIVDGIKIVDIEGLDEPVYAGMASEPVILSEGEYFVIGDNRKESIDSRYEEIGLVTDTRIMGKAFLQLLPLKDFKFL